jgi:hypothetical protein
MRGSQLFSRGIAPDIVTRGAPDGLSKIRFVSPVYACYIIRDYVVLQLYLTFVRPYVLRVPDFCTCPPSDNHNRALRN